MGGFGHNHRKIISSLKSWKGFAEGEPVKLPYFLILLLILHRLLTKTLPVIWVWGEGCSLVVWRAMVTRVFADQTSICFICVAVSQYQGSLQSEDGQQINFSSNDPWRRRRSFLYIQCV